MILDVDTTDDPLHGKLEVRFFHGYYKRYCCRFTSSVGSICCVRGYARRIGDRPTGMNVNPGQPQRPRPKPLLPTPLRFDLRGSRPPVVDPEPEVQARQDASA